MGRSRYQIRHEQAPHFLTCTVLNWMPLFTRPETVNIIIDALHYRQEQLDWKIYGFSFPRAAWECIRGALRQTNDED